MVQSCGHRLYPFEWPSSSSGSQIRSGHLVRSGEHVANFVVNDVILFERH